MAQIHVFVGCADVATNHAGLLQSRLDSGVPRLGDVQDDGSIGQDDRQSKLPFALDQLSE